MFGISSKLFGLLNAVFDPTALYSNMREQCKCRSKISKKLLWDPVVQTHPKFTYTWNRINCMIRQLRRFEGPLVVFYTLLQYLAFCQKTQNQLLNNHDTCHYYFVWSLKVHEWSNYFTQQFYHMRPRDIPFWWGPCTIFRAKSWSKLKNKVVIWSVCVMEL